MIPEGPPSPHGDRWLYRSDRTFVRLTAVASSEGMDQPKRTSQRLSIEERNCPHCGSDDTRLVQRGLAGNTDTHDQYFSCSECGKTTYEIVSRTPREIRVGRLEAGRHFRHEGSDYVVSRVLKVGLNESLVYVKPAPEQDNPTIRLPRLRR